LEESQLVSMKSLDLMFDLDVFKLTWLSYEVITWNFILIGFLLLSDEIVYFSICFSNSFMLTY
jgi:hypothetical protein